MSLNPVAQNDPHVAAHNDERGVINQLLATVGPLATQSQPSTLADKLAAVDKKIYTRYESTTYSGTTQTFTVPVVVYLDNITANTVVANVVPSGLPCYLYVKQNVQRLNFAGIPVVSNWTTGNAAIVELTPKGAYIQNAGPVYAAPAIANGTQLATITDMPKVNAQPTTVGKTISLGPVLADGTVLIEYGDYGANTGPIDVIGWHPTEGYKTFLSDVDTERIEYRLLSSGVWGFPLDSKSNITCELVTNQGGTWRKVQASIPGHYNAPVHTYDMAQLNSDIYLSGVRELSAGQEVGFVWKSSDLGVTWTEVVQTNVVGTGVGAKMYGMYVVETFGKPAKKVLIASGIDAGGVMYYRLHPDTQVWSRLVPNSPFSEVIYKPIGTKNGFSGTGTLKSGITVDSTTYELIFRPQLYTSADYPLDALGENLIRLVNQNVLSGPSFVRHITTISSLTNVDGAVRSNGDVYLTNGTYLKLYRASDNTMVDITVPPAT